jgi:phosphoglycolate phosphatase
MVKEIIFDFDGTLADTFELSVEIFNEIKDRFGFAEIDRKMIDDFRNLGFREVISEVKMPLWKLPRIIKVHQEIMLNRTKDIKIFPGAKEVIEKLKEQGFSVGILTSNSKENVEKVLNNNKMPDFDYIQSGKNLFGKDKNLKLILRKRKLRKEEVVYVGDEVRDIQACKKAEIKIISVAWGFNSVDALKKQEPDWLINKPEEILAIVRK